MTDMTDTIDTLVRTATKHIDSYDLAGKLEAVLGPDHDIPALVWEARRAGRLGARHTWTLMDLLKRAPFDVDDYVTLLIDFAHAFPDGKVHTSEYSYSTLWDPTRFAGWCGGFHDLLDAKIASDPGFLSALASRTEPIPKPVQTALRYMLAFHGHHDPEQLPEGLIDALARAVVSDSDSWGDRYILDFNPWPEEQWRGALVRALFDPNVTSIKNFEILVTLIPHLEDQQLAAVFSKCGTQYSETLGPARALAARPASAIGPFEDAIVEAPEGTWLRNNDTYGGFHLMMAYCVLCQAHGRAPDARTQDALTKFMTSFQFGWSGSSFDTYRDEVYELVRVFPLEMLDATLGDETFNWAIAGAIDSTKGAEAAAAALAIPPTGYEYDFDSTASGCFRAQGADVAIPALSEALLAGAFTYIDRRVTATTLLAMFHDAAAATALAHALADSSKKVRDAAIAGLRTLPDDAALDVLEGPLHAKKKAQREAAAQVLVSLPSSARRHALASGRLEKEKSKGVIELLERVEAVDDSSTPTTVVPEDLMTEGLARLEETRGKAWAELVESHGFELTLPIYIQFLTQHAHDSYLYSFNAPLEQWFALVAAAPADLILEPVVFVAGYAGDSDYFDAVVAAKPLPGLPEALIQRVLTSRFSHPLEPDESGWAVKHRMSEADVASWLATHHPTDYAPIALSRLSAKKKSDRSDALDFISSHPSLFSHGDVTPLLSAKKADAREYAAHALAALADPSSRDALEARLAKEKSAKVKAAIELAVAAIASASFDASTFASGADGDAAIDAALSAQPTVGPPARLASALTELPSPTWAASGEAMSAAALEWFVSELAREDEDRHSPNLLAVRRRLDDGACHALCEAIITLHGTGDHDWGLYPQAVIASPERIEETGRKLETYASSQSYGWGSHGVNVLARYGTDAAARVLDDWHHKTRRDALRWRANEGVHQIARAQGVSVEELLERSLPTFGFDARGEREIDFGSQQFTFRLGALNALEYVRDGKVLKSVPSRRVADDDQLVADSKAFIKRARADIKRITRAQRRRFEGAMFTGRSWEVSVWRDRYARHPLMRSFIQGLVWGLCDADGALLTPFQLDESYGLVDAGDDAVSWSQGQRVRIIHPIEMTPAQRSAWTERFMDFEIVESFPQLTRAVYDRADWPERGEALYMRLERVAEKVFLGHLNRRGYQLGPREDAGLINASSRQVGPYYITVSHSGFAPEFEMGQDVSIEGVSVSRDGEAVALDDLPDNAFSEVVADLVALTTT